MGLFSKISGGSHASPKTSSKAGKPTRQTEHNVLHNPSAYLAYGNDGVDRGAMMAQQAATRTHQQAMDALKQKQVREEQMPKPRTTLPAPKNGASKNADLGSSETGTVADKINFSAFNKVTRVYFKDCLNAEWRHAFTEFGFDQFMMMDVEEQQEHGMKGVVDLAVKKTYKKESAISENGWDMLRERNAGATGRYITRFCRYNGITVSLKGGYDKEKREVFFDFIVPTSKQEFLDWRRSLMAQYNPKRLARGLEPINIDNTHKHEFYLDHEVEVYAQ